MKKLFVPIIAVMLSAMLTYTAAADTGLPAEREAVDSYLLSVGIPEDFIDRLPDEFAAEMYAQLYAKELICDVMPTSLYSIRGGERVPSDSDEPEFMLVRVIELEREADTDREIVGRVWLYFGCEWSRVPLLHDEDIITLCWDDDTFIIEPDTFRFAYYQLDGSGDLHTGEIYHNPARYSDGRMEFSFSLEPRYGDRGGNGMRGFGRVALTTSRYPMYLDETIQDGFSAEYTHSYGFLSRISVSIGKTSGVTISITAIVAGVVAIYLILRNRRSA